MPSSTSTAKVLKSSNQSEEIVLKTTITVLGRKCKTGFKELFSNSQYIVDPCENTYVNPEKRNAILPAEDMYVDPPSVCRIGNNFRFTLTSEKPIKNDAINDGILEFLDNNLFTILENQTEEGRPTMLVVSPTKGRIENHENVLIIN